MDERAVLQQLESWLRAQGRETLFAEENGLRILKTRLAGLGGVDGTALSEICFLPQSTVLQIFTTFASGMDENNLVPAMVAYNTLNLTCPVGSFQVFTGQKQAYHKYAVPLTGDGEACLAQALAAVRTALETLNVLFPQAIVIADDARNFKG